MAIDGDTIANFFEANPVCLQEGKPDWLFPKLCSFYKNGECKPKIDTLLKQLGTCLEEQAKSHPLWEITSIDKSKCIDDSYVEDFIHEEKRYESGKYRFQELQSPYKTIKFSLALKDIPSNAVKELTYKYGSHEHPYILSDIANCYILSGDFISAFPLLYRSAKQLGNYPNTFWNSEYGIIGAANTFRHLVAMARDVVSIETYLKLLKLYYLYLSRLVRVVKDKLCQQSGYVNRAVLDLDPYVFSILPIGINPELLYISDMYYAHYCNELAVQVSSASGCRYDMQSLKYYQHASLWPNSTGGYVEIEDKTYIEIVEQKNQQADSVAYGYLDEIKSGVIAIERKELNSLFQILEKESRNNYLKFKNKVLQFKQ